MTRRGLLGCFFAVPLRPQPQDRTVETHDLCPGWSETIDEPTWLHEEEIDEKNFRKWRPKAEYTTTTRVYRTVNHA